MYRSNAEKAKVWDAVQQNQITMLPATPTNNGTNAFSKNSLRFVYAPDVIYALRAEIK